MRFIFYLILFAFLGVGLGRSQNYLWPTNASTYLSSSFCEYRPGHFHSAIDIKTWNREGYKCFAVSDGKIDHIRISPFGGGKALYIRLKDGRMAVYYHLSRFPRSIEREIRKLQLRQKKFRVEWWPKNRFVKKGQVVAYTGQSGIGVPHLHFEIRDHDNHPLNPLQFYPRVKDTIAPVLQELLVIPQDENSKAGFSFMPHRIKLVPQKGNRYSLAEPIYASGVIGLALRGFDRGNGVGNKLNFYGITFLLGGRPVFHMAYDRLSFSKTAQADVDVYYPERARSRKQFHKLYLNPYNTLSFYDRSLGDGLINVTDKIKDFKIKVRDFKGNTSIVEGQIVPFLPRPGKLQQVTKLNNNAYIRFTLPDSLKFMHFSSGKSIDHLLPVNYYEIIDRRPRPDGASVLIKLTLNSPMDHLLQISFQKGTLPPVTSIVRLDNQTLMNDKPRVRLINYGKNIVIQMENLNPAGDIHFRAGDSASFTRRPVSVINNHSEIVLPARDVRGAWRFYVTQSDSVLLDSLVCYNLLYPDSLQSLSFFDGSIRVQSNHAPYDTLLFSLEKQQRDSIVFPLPVFGPIYDFSPGNRILKKHLLIYFKSDPGFMNGRHTAIYSVDNKHRLTYNGGVYDSTSHFIALRTKTLGRYIIAADTIPPLVKVLSPQASQSYKRFPSIRFSVIDSISGIGRPENITVYLDDRFIISEWDPERKLVTARPDYMPKKGRHTLRIEVHDQSDNYTRKKIVFRLK